jgi:hypothetical protein
MPPFGQLAEDGIIVADVGWIPDGEKNTQQCVLLTLSAQISYYLQVRTRATPSNGIMHSQSAQCLPPELSSVA